MPPILHSLSSLLKGAELCHYSGWIRFLVGTGSLAVCLPRLIESCATSSVFYGELGVTSDLQLHGRNGSRNRTQQFRGTWKPYRSRG